MVNFQSVRLLWLPSEESEPERKWPSGLGVAIVDVGHQASGLAATMPARTPTSQLPVGPPHADRVQFPETDLREFRFASYSGGVPCRRQPHGLSWHRPARLQRLQRALLRGVPGPIHKRNGGPIVLQWTRI